MMLPATSPPQGVPIVDEQPEAELSIDRSLLTCSTILLARRKLARLPWSGQTVSQYIDRLLDEACDAE